MFKNGEGPSLKEDFKNRFRNVSRIMDCVGCDKCRLWGKLQTAGYGTALKILFEFDNNSADVPDLKRTELVALFNLYSRLSSSMEALRMFRGMVEADESHDVESIRERAKKEHAEDRPPSPSDEKAAKTGAEQDDDEYTWEEEDITPSKQPPKRPRTTGEMLKSELQLIAKVTKHVFTSWISFPKTLYRIALLELERLWQFYIGLPITPRTWRFQRRSLDEL
ncbi:hypothetical protein DL767_005172 [Monosporascus sp. MG133]|nr:hypothetical protein DL767_005172 [Monosporascus sp. MG133]